MFRLVIFKWVVILTVLVGCLAITTVDNKIGKIILPMFMFLALVCLIFCIYLTLFTSYCYGDV